MVIIHISTKNKTQSVTFKDVFYNEWQANQSSSFSDNEIILITVMSIFTIACIVINMMLFLQHLLDSSFIK